MSSTDDYRDRIEAERRQKDEFFTEHPRSPVAPDARETFEGLRYFEVDPSVRFEVELERHASPERIVVETTQDGEQSYDDVGTFTVTIDGEAVTLHAFQPLDAEHRLWVPFRDATSGEETYSAGRYLDLEDPDNRTGENWVLDFNEAYNPFCAYSDAYECPVVPVDNWLDVPVRAGEKAPELDVH